MAHRLYLDRPVYEQYLHFLGQLVFHGSLGYSFNDRQSVNSSIFAAAPVTASLVLGGAMMWMLIAVPIGILSALKPRSMVDRFAMVGVLGGISAHPVWIGLMASYIFGYKLNLLPDPGLLQPARRRRGPDLRRAGGLVHPHDDAVDHRSPCSTRRSTCA